MITECISAICTLGLVVLAILITTRAISLEDALKAMGKAFLLLFILYFAVCMLVSPVRAGFAALVALLATAIRWLVVAVIIIAPLILLLWMLLRKSVMRRSAKSNRDGGEW
jgi:hypothetical protein